MLNLILDNINRSSNQLISYAKFIELALYHPESGYYMRDQVKIGKSGDFITTSNVSDIFGMLFSKWFLKHVVKNKIKPAVCEIGAGNGRFAKAFIDTWQKNSDIQLSYFIVETSPYHRKLQQELLPLGHGVYQVNELAELKPFNGFIFSNELFDALPVHVIEMKNGKLCEVMVGKKVKNLLNNPFHYLVKKLSHF